MSNLLEQINAEQERVEREEKIAIYNRLDEMQANLDKMQDMLLVENMLRIQDMHDFIHSNPTLKGELKELTCQRYLEIFKTNHANHLKVKFDHDNNAETDPITLEDFIDTYF